MKVLVTGGSGMVGHAIKKFQPNYIFLSSKDGDLRFFDQTEKIFTKHKPDLVIHLAADVGGLFKNMEKKVEMFENNMLINMNVLKCCWQFKVKKVVSCLSTCIFPDAVKYPLTEEMLHIGEPHNSNYGYAYAKRMIDVLSKCYNEMAGKTVFTTISPTNVYGPYDNFHPQNSHVVASVIRQCCESNKVTLMGTGEPKRQFIFSEDLAQIILWMIDNYSSTETLIASPSEEITIKTLAEIVAKQTNSIVNFTNDHSQNGQMIKTVSNKKLLDLFHFDFTSLEDGLIKTVKWYLSQK